MPRPTLEDFLQDPSKIMRAEDAERLLKKAGFKDKSHEYQHQHRGGRMRSNVARMEFSMPDGRVIGLTIERISGKIPLHLKHDVLRLCKTAIAVREQQQANEEKEIITGPDHYINQEDNSRGMAR